jgi:hypothetical protein
MIGHGLFQCSGDFLVNEEQSLAFSLVEKGYDVWLGNNRAVGTLDHISLSHKDPEYWNWGLKELAIYDFTAMIDHVREYTGYSKVSSLVIMLKVRQYSWLCLGCLYGSFSRKRASIYCIITLSRSGQ